LSDAPKASGTSAKRPLEGASTDLGKTRTVCGGVKDSGKVLAKPVSLWVCGFKIKETHKRRNGQGEKKKGARDLSMQKRAEKEGAEP